MNTGCLVRRTRRGGFVVAMCGLLSGLALALPGAAAAATGPFGFSCSDTNGVRFCPDGYTPPSPQSPPSAVERRVPTFDGVPLDVDVTLPPASAGPGPYPTIVMLHGYGGSKNDFESTKPEGNGNTTYHYNNVYYARRGYAVLNYTARGFGNSCGSPASRSTTPACAKGWIHLKDRAYEARDTQYLLGELVDQGFAKPDALGATGISYGGGESIELALLHDQQAQRPDSTPAGRTAETLVPWKSRARKPLALAAAWPRWPWSDLVYSLVPNGHFLDFNNATNGSSRDPIGIPIQTYIEGLFASGAASGYYAPPRVDPSADLADWHNRVLAGDPFADPYAQEIVDEIFGHHQGFGLLDVPQATAAPAPLLIENGWTDDLFPPAEALRIYNDLRRRDPNADVALQFGDLGHARGQNKKNTNVAFDDQGSSFFDSHLKGAADSAPPAKGSVTTFTQTCPADAPAGGPFTAASWPAIHPGAFRFGDQDPKLSQTVTSAGGNPQTGKTLDPIAGGGACATVADETAPGTAVYRAKTGGFTLMGLPTVTARVSVTGPSPQLDSRLWDVAPDGNQRLISRGAYRLSGQDISSGRVTFQLHGNGWHFDAGHTAKLELLGKDEPYLQPNKEPFQIAVSGLVVELPTLEPPTSTEPFSTPPPNTTPATGGGGGGSVIVSPTIGQGKPLPKAARRLHLDVSPKRVSEFRLTRLRFVVTTRFNHRIYRVARVTVRIAGRKVSTNSRGRASIVLRFRSRGRRAVRADRQAFAGDRRHIVVVRPHRRR